MHKNTKLIKEKISQATSIEEKLKVLKNAYKNETCYVLTAGPSVKTHDKTKLNEFLSDKLVITIKQTLNICNELSDFHLLNPYNYKKYKYQNPNTIVGLVKALGRFSPLPAHRNDFTLFINSNTADNLAEACCYEKYLLENNLERPFGPGIMHEIGIYLPVHLGVKEIIVLGWDLGSKNTNVIHRYYENNSLFSKIEKFMKENFIFFYNKFYIKIRNLVSYAFSLIGFNPLLNVPGVTKDEAKMIAKKSHSLYEWLQEKGIELKVVSETSMLDERIPRVKLGTEKPSL